MAERTRGGPTPRRRGLLWRRLGAALLRLFGWRIEGKLPDLPRLVAVVAPHTSNWDFFFAICAIFALGIEAHWVGKHTLFRGPLGGFMRWLGGTPIDRRAPEGRVAQIVAQMSRLDRFVLGISPEGTRGRVQRWKTGFYHVALGTGAPILLTYLDYSRKVVGIGPLFVPTGQLDVDVAAIRAFYDPRWAKYPDRV